MPVQENSKPRVVVGIDGSPDAERALAWAVRYARLTGAEIHAVMSVYVPYSAYDASDGSDLVEWAQETLTTSIGKALASGEAVPVVPTVVRSHPSAALLDQAEDADLLVVGSRGRGAFKRALLGSVSQSCVQHARCPVVVVRGDTPAGDS